MSHGFTRTDQVEESLYCVFFFFFPSHLTLDGELRSVLCEHSAEHLLGKGPGPQNTAAEMLRSTSKCNYLFHSGISLF